MLPKPKSALLACVLVGVLASSCASDSTMSRVASSPVPIRLSPASLPPVWTPTLTLTPAATATPRPPATSAATVHPADTPTRLPQLHTATVPYAKMSLVHGSPAELVQQAFEAYLQGDEQAFLPLLDESGERMCKSVLYRDLLDCIGLPYRAKGLTSLQDWYVSPKGSVDSEDYVALASLVTRWANSATTWSQMFYMIKINEHWYIYQIDITIYEE